MNKIRILTQNTILKLYARRISSRSNVPSPEAINDTIELLSIVLEFISKLT